MNAKASTVLLLAAAWLSACGGRSAPSGPPRRIVSITITGDVLLGALVDSSRVLAVSALADDSGIHEQAGLFPGKPRLGADLERILALRPDLLLMGSFHDPAFLDATRRSGLRTLVLESPRSLAGVRAFVKRVADTLGEPARGDSLALWMDSVLADVAARAARCPERPRVLFWSDGFTAGDSSTVGELIERAGARNAAREAGIHGSQAIPVETVVRLSPDWILRGSWEQGGDGKPLPEAMAALPAVRAGHVAALPSKLLLSTSHRSALGAELLLATLHPECGTRP